MTELGVSMEAAGVVERESSISMVDMFKMDEKQKRELKEAIERYKGHVQIFVHSHYDEETSQKYIAQKRPFAEQVASYLKERDKTLETLLSSSTQFPTIFLIDYKPGQFAEDDNEVQKYAAALQTLSKDAGKEVYFVRTYPQNPTPYSDISNPTMSGEIKRETASRDEEWDRMASLLKALGVTDAVINGQYYEAWTDDFPDNATPLRNSKVADDFYYAQQHPEHLSDTGFTRHENCVGTTLTKLQRRGVNTVTSQVVAPFHAVANN